MKPSFQNVLEAARARMAMLFDQFGRVVVSISGGKDSTVVYHLALEAAEARGRTVEVMFLDQEAEYQGTVDQIDHMMRHPSVIPKWFQIPMRLTNATSHQETWLHAWRDGDEWVRPLSDLGTHDEVGAPDRFYDFFPWYEAQSLEPTAWIVGLRSRESLNRWRSMAKNPGFGDIFWSTKTKANDGFRFYPIFDWNVGDVWKFIADSGVRYNRVYDAMFALKGANQRTIRVSNLVHEQAFKALADLQEIEPDTYERLIRRLRGVHCAALYATDRNVYDAKSLPAAFGTWQAYRDHLIATTPIDYLDRFRRRFARQPTDEATCREQVRQLLTNDWEDNVPVRRVKADRLRMCWWDRL